MRFLTRILASLLLFGGLAHAAITRVQHDVNFTAGPSVTATSNVLTTTTGNLLVVGVGQSGDSSDPTCTDTALNTFTKIGSISPTNAADANIGLFYAKNITGNAADVVTCTWGGAQQFMPVFTIEYSGIDTSAPLDATPAPVNTGGSGAASITTGTFSTSHASEVLVGVARGNSGGIAYTAGTESGGYSIVDNDTNGSAIEDNIVSSTQTGVTMTMTTGGIYDLGLVGASFKSAAPPPTTGAFFF